MKPRPARIEDGEIRAGKAGTEEAQPFDKAMRDLAVIIDAGHGGKDPGALGPGGYQEKVAALAVALLLGGMLEAAGVDVFYTRKDDRFLELSERAHKGNELGVDLFISIHCNSAERPAAGFEVYSTPGKTKSDDAATEIFKSWGVKFPGRARRADSSDGDPDKEANFAVLRLSHGAAVLVELEFIHTPEGEAFLMDPANQAHCAEALADGVLAFLGMTAAPVQAPAVPAPVAAPGDIRAEVARLANELLSLAKL